MDKLDLVEMYKALIPIAKIDFDSEVCISEIAYLSVANQLDTYWFKDKTTELKNSTNLGNTGCAGTGEVWSSQEPGKH